MIRYKYRPWDWSLFNKRRVPLALFKSLLTPSNLAPMPAKQQCVLFFFLFSNDSSDVKVGPQRWNREMSWWFYEQVLEGCNFKRKCTRFRIKGHMEVNITHCIKTQEIHNPLSFEEKRKKRLAITKRQKMIRNWSKMKHE